MRKARVLITLKCHRQCPYCCNNYADIKAQMRRIKNLDSVCNYDEVMITGGEPMQYPKKVMGVIHQLRKQNPNAPMYLYTAYYSVFIYPITRLVDGIHYTLHANSTSYDLIGFRNFQHLIGKYPEKSFRLYIHPEVKHKITIIPNLWKRVEVKPWMPEGECPLPEGEELFVLE